MNMSLCIFFSNYNILYAHWHISSNNNHLGRVFANLRYRPIQEKNDSVFYLFSSLTPAGLCGSFRTQQRCSTVITSIVDNLELQGLLTLRFGVNNQNVCHPCLFKKIMLSIHTPLKTLRRPMWLGLDPSILCSKSYLDCGRVRMDPFRLFRNLFLWLCYTSLSEER